jgi:hypothetical protein
MPIPTFQEVVGGSASVLLAICEALGDAERWTQDFFSRYAESAPDRNLAPNLMRYFALRYLDNTARALLTAQYEREPISNNGILVLANQYQIRVRKAVDGFELPPPVSEVLEDFYNQGQLLLPLPATRSDPVEIKLVLLWDVGRDYGITSLALVLPRSGGKSPTAYWAVPLSIDGLRQATEDNNLDIRPRPDTDDSSEESGTD